MTTDRHLALMNLMRAIEEPAKTYRRSVRLAASLATDSAHRDAAVAKGYAALDDIDTAVRDWIAAHPAPEPLADVSRPRTTPPMVCINCETPVGWVDCPTGGWWAHETHPSDGHDADPRPALEAAPAADTLPAWLYQRFMQGGVDWDAVDDDDRAYWAHQAAAVRRAVARGGFKQPATPAAVETHVVADDSNNPEHTDDCPGCVPAVAETVEGTA